MPDPINDKNLLKAALGVSELETSVPPESAKRHLRRQWKTDLEMEGFGFPASTAENFRKTAENMNAVVSSRVPGGATTELIEMGHDLKSYFVKSKSCNWGPMSGFLCVHPAFNKKGAGGIGHNRNSYRKYVRHLSVENNDPGGEKAEGDVDYIKPENSIPHNLKGGMLQYPFVPIQVASDRFLANAIPEGASEETTKTYILKEVDDDYVGIAWSSDKSVAFEFVAVKKKVDSSSYFELRYGQVFSRPEDSKPEDDAALKAFSNPFSGYESLVVGSDSGSGAEIKEIKRRAELSSFWEDSRLPAAVKGLGSRPRSPASFRPINGIINPFPPYTKPRDQFKNAVTGDYDLFAVWPRGSESSDLTRVTEINYVRNNLFERAPFDKPLALRSSINRNLILDFIPNYAEITPLESNQVGNINPAVMLAAGTLNSLECVAPISPSPPPPRAGAVGVRRVASVAASPARLTGPRKPSPNRAFHSDEGGRPGIDEIEFPVAFFLPRATATAIGMPEGQEPQLIIETPKQFLALICLLVRNHAIPLNFGWWIDLCVKAGGTADEAEHAEIKKYVEFLLIGSAENGRRRPTEGSDGAAVESHVRSPAERTRLEKLVDPVRMAFVKLRYVVPAPLPGEVADPDAAPLAGGVAVLDLSQKSPNWNKTSEEKMQLILNAAQLPDLADDLPAAAGGGVGDGADVEDVEGD